MLNVMPLNIRHVISNITIIQSLYNLLQASVTLFKSLHKFVVIKKIQIKTVQFVILGIDFLTLRNNSLILGH